MSRWEGTVESDWADYRGLMAEGKGGSGRGVVWCEDEADWVLTHCIRKTIAFLHPEPRKLKVPAFHSYNLPVMKLKMKEFPHYDCDLFNLPTITKQNVLGMCRWAFITLICGSWAHSGRPAALEWSTVRDAEKPFPLLSIAIVITWEKQH